MRAKILNILFIFITFIFIFSGCASLLPSSQITTKSLLGNSYQEVSALYGKIKCGNTVRDLKKEGTILNGPNVKIRNWFSVQQKFMHNPNIKHEDLPLGVQKFINAGEKGLAYEITLQNTQNKRKGNFFLDFLGFKRITEIKGWDFNGLILIVDGIVIYKLTPAEGTPEINRTEVQKKPLGPLQNAGDAIIDTGKKLFID